MYVGMRRTIMDVSLALSEDDRAVLYDTMCNLEDENERRCKMRRLNSRAVHHSAA